MTQNVLVKVMGTHARGHKEFNFTPLGVFQLTFQVTVCHATLKRTTDKGTRLK